MGTLVYQADLTIQMQCLLLFKTQLKACGEVEDQSMLPAFMLEHKLDCDCAKM